MRNMATKNSRNGYICPMNGNNQEKFIKVWRETYKVTWDGAGASGRLGLPHLTSYMQETAWHHAQSLGVGFEANKQDNRAWALMRMEIWTERLPGWEESLTVETWPAGIEGFLALRNFRFLDHENQPYGRAATAWLIIDAETRRPRRPDAFEYLSKAVVPADKPVMPAPRKIKTPEGNLLKVISKKVSYSDIDMHGHVNNSRYIGWFLDALPTSWHLNNQIGHLCINFLQETFENEVIDIYFKELAEGELFVQGMREADNKTIFTAELNFTNHR
ncbi:MAG: hypothetical protein HPY80_02060 [Bacteroidales bacterium]|jgi:acyl-ACP thioesterase|nr:hypothetical protein [Bacteroidales bacterium]NPV35434.1 hypothetical protein [Bacteroidales bacterium]